RPAPERARRARGEPRPARRGLPARAAARERGGPRRPRGGRLHLRALPRGRALPRPALRDRLGAVRSARAARLAPAGVGRARTGPAAEAALKNGKARALAGLSGIR